MIVIPRLLAFVVTMCVLCPNFVSADTQSAPAPKKKIKVFILAGQSNMEGRTDGSKLDRASRARLEGVQDRVQLAFNFEPVQPLDVQKASKWIVESYKVDRIFGPELFFGIGLAEAWSDDEILLIKRTEGGTSLYGCWNPDWEAEKAEAMGETDRPNLYGDLITYTRDVLSTYRTDAYEICGVLWVQGERDSEEPLAAANYGENLRKLVERFRVDLVNPNLPFLLFQVGRGKVVEGMQQVAREVPNVVLIPQSLDPDSADFYDKIPNGHYNHLGQKKLGLRFAEAYLKACCP